MINTSQQLGGSVGTALLSTIFASAAAGYSSTHPHAAGLANAASLHGYTTAYAWAAGLFGAGLLARRADPPLRRRGPGARRQCPGRR